MTRVGSHPTMRLDSFVRATDTGFQHGEAPAVGDRFVRRMASYGSVRPSACFTSESRATRLDRHNLTFEASNLPALWNDPKGDPREGTLEYQLPPKEDSSFLKMLKNDSLMLPSERYKEHMELKAGMDQFLQDRAEQSIYHKRMKVLEKHHPNGVIGVDGPMFPETRLYAQRRAQLVAGCDARERHGRNRHGHITDHRASDETLNCEKYGEEHGMERSRDLCIQRKRVDPEMHPQRYLNTHSRLFPEARAATWDPARAANIRAHDVRDRRHNIVSGADTSEHEFRVAQFQQPSVENDLYGQAQ